MQTVNGFSTFHDYLDEVNNIILFPCVRSAPSITNTNISVSHKQKAFLWEELGLTPGVCMFGIL